MPGEAVDDHVGEEMEILVAAVGVRLKGGPAGMPEAVAMEADLPEETAAAIVRTLTTSRRRKRTSRRGRPEGDDRGRRRPRSWDTLGVGSMPWKSS